MSDTAYNPERQYRCTIVRGRAQSELDNLLPAYANIVDMLCPCDKDYFAAKFNEYLNRLIHQSEKSLSNHRTEIAGQLFGLWYEEEGIAHPTEKCEKILETNDQPSFFKDLVLKIHFPNGMDKIQTTKKHIENEIHFRPVPFVLKLLLIADHNETDLTRDELAYYVFNSLEILQGNHSPEIVFKTIIKRRKEGDIRKVEYNGHGYSYAMQHINEQLNLMELANLIRTYKKGHTTLVIINSNERETVEYMADEYINKFDFNAYDYDLDEEEEKKQFQLDWNIYYGSVIDDDFINSETNAKNLLGDDELDAIEPVSVKDPLAIGDEGEDIAMKYEKERVKSFNKRLGNKVVYLGKQKGLGFDISSIRADDPEPENNIYIEVKTTKRVTPPSEDFQDSFFMTRNEWVSCKTNKENYFIYRIFIYRDGYKIFRMRSPSKLNEENKIYAKPTKYRIEFDEESGVFINGS